MGRIGLPWNARNEDPGSTNGACFFRLEMREVNNYNCSY